MNDSDLENRIKEANRKIYNNVSPEEYNRNESIFNEKRKEVCSVILKNAASTSGKDSYLDIGTGTGNLLRLAVNYFQNCTGVDISENLLTQIRPSFPECTLLAADAENLPFPPETFNCVSCYALLHHLLKHEKLFRECHRVLKPGGTLYTDHDPNYFFNRFYHIYYQLRFNRKHGFGSETGDLAEYHNVFSPGINPEELRKLLLSIGFRKVKVTYRMTDRENWGFFQKSILKILRVLSKIIPLKSFYTHFSILAVK